MRERLQATPSPAVCRYLFQPAIASDEKRSFHNMLTVNKAHTLMLRRQGILTDGEGGAILKELLELERQGKSSFPLNPELEDYYFNIEHQIIQRVGMEVGGKLHTARSRNDLHSTVSRMNVRDELLALYPKVLKLREVLLEQAEAHKGTVFTGYTHLQPAQPISLAFYLTAVAQGLERDFARMLEAYPRLNLCTLGSGAFAGTSFPIDRHYVAERLGFDAPMYNSMDAVASRDYLLELIGSFVCFGATVNRFVQDLYLWTTDEFAYIEVADAHAASSSIMPQKKNPVTLEHCKAKVSHLLGAYVSTFSCMKGIPYGHCRDLAGESIQPFWEAAGQMEAILALLTETVGGLKVKPNHMKVRADRNFSTVTELADALVKREGISFREAHHIVGIMVGECVESGLDCSHMTLDWLNRAYQQQQNRPLNWTEEELGLVLDSGRSVEGKTSLGGPSPEQCQNMLDALWVALLQDKKALEQLSARQERAADSLDREVKEICAVSVE